MVLQKEGVQKEQAIAAVRYVGNRCFYCANERWYDSQFDTTKEQMLQNVDIGSEEYLALIKAEPQPGQIHGPRGIRGGDQRPVVSVQRPCAEQKTPHLRVAQTFLSVLQFRTDRMSVPPFTLRNSLSNHRFRRFPNRRNFFVTFLILRR